MKPGQVHAAPLHPAPHRADRDHPATAVSALACPHCATPVTVDGDRFVCARGHSFDVARQGYVSLLGPRARTDTGDDADMVAARAEFLGSGWYAPIAAAVARAAPGRGPVVEIGAGTGYYLRAVLDAGGGSTGIAVDSSRYAARRAAADRRVLSVLADAWSPLPLADGSVSTVLSVFAPRTPAEIVRVLAPDGVLVAVTPEVEHLHELRARVAMLDVDEGKADRLADAFAGLLRPVERRQLRYPLQLDRDAVSALVRMGPSTRHLTAAELAAQLAPLPPLSTVTVAVTVSTFGKG